MKLTKKHLKAVDLIAGGTSACDAAKALSIDQADMRKWLEDASFVSAVEARNASLAREGRWLLMQFRDAALAVYEKGMTGQRVTTAEEKVSNNILRTLGVIKSEPVTVPPQSGEIKCQFGSRKVADVKKELEEEDEIPKDAST